MTMSPTVLAVVLPQFHPIPENDRWWGRGFTEWTNVAKAQPLLADHYQPHLPGELGFYDLRLPEVRQQQADLAREHGIAGFCYYHYWFNGHQLLDRPLREVLNSGAPNFPFCICWANENWTRAWDGRDREVLFAQEYSTQDDAAHIDSLIPYLKDPRYIRVGGRPLLIVYKVGALPDPKATFALWRRKAMEAGVGELCLAQFESGGTGTAVAPAEAGLDLSIEFMPDWRNLGGRMYATAKAKVAMNLGLVSKAYNTHKFCDYRRMVAGAMNRSAPAYPLLRCVSPGFDSTPRRPRNATVLVNSSPDAYGQWLSAALDWTRLHNPPTTRSSSSMPGTSGEKAITSNPMPAMDARILKRPGRPSTGLLHTGVPASRRRTRARRCGATDARAVQEPLEARTW